MGQRISLALLQLPELRQRFLLTHAATHLLVTWEKQPENTYLRGGELSGAFHPVYPVSESFDTSPVKVYELRYPAGIETHPEYLKAGR